MSESNLIDILLAEQQSLTAVERFSQKQASGEFPDQERYYRDLIPLTTPTVGEQYAFAVDMDKCTGCKACVSACHSLNGLDEGEAWRDIGLLHVADEGVAYQQTVTTACHHCLDPACAEGCPVLAYEKDEDTGIVRHLDDQCIGCQYCILKCPYDVPKYSTKRGIVRKCDMCHQRLAVGEAPACVQACPSGAIAIQIVSQVAIRGTTKIGDRLLPGAFDSTYTRPTTSYTNARGIPADAKSLRVEHTHWPLVIMLVLTQVAIGMVGAEAVSVATGRAQPIILLAAIVLFHLGLVASITHLGQPLKAWRAFLGLRRSWLSREIIGFGMVPPLLLAAAALDWLPKFAPQIPILGHFCQNGLLVIGKWSLPFDLLVSGLLLGAFLTGLLCIFCSVMVYEDTRRSFWSLPRTGAKFFGTMLVGVMASIGFLVPLAAVLLLKIALEVTFLRHSKNREWTPDKKTALTILGPLRLTLTLRLLCATLGLVVFAFQPVVGALLIGMGEIAERTLFFRAVVAPKMPGGI